MIEFQWLKVFTLSLKWKTFVQVKVVFSSSVKDEMSAKKWMNVMHTNTEFIRRWLTQFLKATVYINTYSSLLREEAGAT